MPEALCTARLRSTSARSQLLRAPTLHEVPGAHAAHRNGRSTAQALPILLFYRSGQAPANKLAFNAQLASTLPSGYPSDVAEGYSGINGNGEVFFMRVMYDEVSPDHRLSVVFHECAFICPALRSRPFEAANLAR